MPLYMKYGEIDGKVETAGYEHWIETQSFQWGTSRSMATPVGSRHRRQDEVGLRRWKDLRLEAPTDLDRRPQPSVQAET